MTTERSPHDRMLDLASRFLGTSWLRAATIALIPLLVITLVVAVLLWVSSSMAIGEAGGARLPSRVTDQIRGQLDAPTRAEQARIRQLGFIGQPYPVLPPMQVGFIPLESVSGGAPWAERQAFSAFRAAFAASGCPSGRIVDSGARDRAANALGSIDHDLQGLSLARLRYHQGLIELCRGIADQASNDASAAQDRFGVGLERFGAALAALDRLDASERWVRQYRVVAELARVLTMRLMNREDVPSVPMPNSADFPGQLCARAATDCDLFSGDDTALAGARLMALLAGDGRGRDTDRQAYLVLKQQRVNFAASSPEVTTNLAAAAAVFGDPRLIGQLLEDSRIVLDANGEAAARWRDSPALARLINLAWISGRVSTSWQPPSSYFSSPPDRLPIELGFAPQGGGQANADIELMRAWNQLGTDRDDLASGQSDGFSRFTARRSGAANETPDTRRFLAEVRDEFAERIGPVLMSAARDLDASPGGEAQSQALLNLLKTDIFPITTRLDAFFYDWVFGISFLTFLVILCVVYLLAAFVYWVLVNLATGYNRAFPRRHYVDRKKAPSPMAES